MDNPFKLHYLNGWEFQIVFGMGGIKIEARGFGICMSSKLPSGESPKFAADKLVYQENLRRCSLKNSWVKEKNKNELKRAPNVMNSEQSNNRIKEKSLMNTVKI